MWVDCVDRSQLQRAADVMVIDSYRRPDGMPRGPVALVVGFPPSARYMDVVFPHDTRHWLGASEAPPVRVWTVPVASLLRRMDAAETVAYIAQREESRARWAEWDGCDDE